MVNLFDVKRLKRSKSAQKRIRAWIKALRSGKYKRGDGFLRLDSPDGKTKWCCLGVMIDVAHPKIWATNDSRNSRATPTVMGELEMPNQEHEREFCLCPDLGEDSTSAGTLADMNDRGRSFKVIAGRLERHLKAALK